MERRYKNLGFSLVELVIVIAIMAILMGMLAPMYLRYVERSRTTMDENFAEEIRKACETLLNDTNENLEMGSYVISITPNSNVSITATGGGNTNHLDTCLKDVLGSDYANTKLKSKSYKEIEVTFTNTSVPVCSIEYN